MTSILKLLLVFFALGCLTQCTKGGYLNEYPDESDSARWVYGFRVGDTWLQHFAQTQGGKYICDTLYTKLVFMPEQRVLYYRFANGILWVRRDTLCENPDLFVMDVNAAIGDTLRLAQNLLEDNSEPIYTPHIVINIDSVEINSSWAKRIWMVYHPCNAPPRRRRRAAPVDTAIWIQRIGFVRPYPFPFAVAPCQRNGAEFCFQELSRWVRHIHYDSIGQDSLRESEVWKRQILWHNSDCITQLMETEDTSETAASLTVRAIPNPAQGHTQLEIVSERAGQATLKMSRIDGQTYPSQRIDLVEGTNSVRLDLPSKGIFLITVEFRRSPPVTIRVVGI